MTDNKEACPAMNDWSNRMHCTQQVQQVVEVLLVLNRVN